MCTYHCCRLFYIYTFTCSLLPLSLFWFKYIYFKNNIHAHYNIVIYINIIGLERKHYSLFGSSPSLFGFAPLSLFTVSDQI